MESLTAQFLSTIANGLHRQSVDSCAKWAAAYRILGKPFPGPVQFTRHPWTVELHNCNQSWVGPKGAQMGYTETGLNRTLYTIDINRTDVLYLLPKKTPDASDFSAARFGPALELSPHLKALFSDVQNVGHKRAGSVNLYIRGTMSKSAVKSVAVGLIVFDELDEMKQANLPQAEERMSGQETKQTIKLSTPTVPNFGIDAEYQQSTQEHFMFKCPSCSKTTELLFPDCLVVTAEHFTDPKVINSHLRCKECGATLPHETKSQWLPVESRANAKAKWEPTANNGSLVRGFWIPQLYSFTVRPWEIAKSYLKSFSNEADEQEFWNSKMGMPHTPKGARVTPEMIDLLLGNHRKTDPPPSRGLITMGVDQGKWIYCHVDQWFLPETLGQDLNAVARRKTLFAGRVSAFEELDLLMRKYQVLQCVIDANPERRKAYEFSTRFMGHVHLCFYNRGLSGKQMDVNASTMTVGVDRTSWLDLSLSRYHRGSKAAILPSDVATDPEYREHICASIRLLKKDSDGNPVARYINIGPDHYGHAQNYSEIALPLAVSQMTNRDIGSFL